MNDPTQDINYWMRKALLLSSVVSWEKIGAIWYCRIPVSIGPNEVVSLTGNASTRIAAIRMAVNSWIDFRDGGDFDIHNNHQEVQHGH